MGVKPLLRSVGAITGAGDETQPSSGPGAFVSSENHESSTIMSEVCSGVCTQRMEVVPASGGSLVLQRAVTRHIQLDKEAALFE